MGYIYGDNNLVIRHIQQDISENFDNNIIVNGTYYEKFDMNYGMAHYIAKYLDYKYPPCSVCLDDYNRLKTGSIDEYRDITQPISLLNYFISDNLGNHLVHSNIVTESIIDSSPITKLVVSDDYEKIYNKYMRANPLENNIYAGFEIYGSYYNTYDQPLLSSVETNDLMYPIATSSTSLTYGPLYYGDTGIIPFSQVDVSGTRNVFYLQPWDIKKGICELDDFVLSYLLGRTITEYSSPEEIYYVQKLLIHDYFEEKEKGVWKTPAHDLTKIICEFQSNHVNRYKNTPLFVTGYFDIFTESIALLENGGVENNVRGL